MYVPSCTVPTGFHVRNTLCTAGAGGGGGGTGTGALPQLSTNANTIINPGIILNLIIDAFPLRFQLSISLLQIQELQSLQYVQSFNSRSLSRALHTAHTVSCCIFS